jgi:hypothetical protein
MVMLSFFVNGAGFAYAYVVAPRVWGVGSAAVAPAEEGKVETRLEEGLMHFSKEGPSTIKELHHVCLAMRKGEDL